MTKETKELEVKTCVIVTLLGNFVADNKYRANHHETRYAHIEDDAMTFRNANIATDYARLMGISNYTIKFL